MTTTVHRDLDFSNAVFHDGVNLTVRRGTKWADAHVGEGLRVTDRGFATDYGATVWAVYTRPFSDADIFHLQLEHDSECRTLEGLYNVMCNVYENFDKDEECTFLFFTII